MHVLRHGTGTACLVTDGLVLRLVHPQFNILNDRFDQQALSVRHLMSQVDKTVKYVKYVKR